MNPGTRLIPKFSLRKKIGYVLMGFVVGYAFYFVATYILFASAIAINHLANLKMSGLGVSLLAPITWMFKALAFSQSFSYVGFLAFAMCLIRFYWHRLNQQGLIDQFRLLPNGHELFARAIMVPTLHIVSSALITFVAIDFIKWSLRGNMRSELRLIIGGTPVSIGGSWSDCISIQHIISIFCLVVLVAIPLWNEISLPSTRRNIIIIAFGFMIPICIYIYMLHSLSEPPGYSQTISTCFIAIILIRARRISVSARAERNQMSPSLNHGRMGE